MSQAATHAPIALASGQVWATASTRIEILCAKAGFLSLLVKGPIPFGSNLNPHPEVPVMEFMGWVRDAGAVLESQPTPIIAGQVWAIGESKLTILSADDGFIRFKSDIWPEQSVREAEFQAIVRVFMADLEPPPVPVPELQQCRIWSQANRLWWTRGENGDCSGHTTLREYAGIWDWDDAVRLTWNLSPNRQVTLVPSYVSLAGSDMARARLADEDLAVIHDNLEAVEGFLRSAPEEGMIVPRAVLLALERDVPSLLVEVMRLRTELTHAHALAYGGL